MKSSALSKQEFMKSFALLVITLITLVLPQTAFSQTTQERLEQVKAATTSAEKSKNLTVTFIEGVIRTIDKAIVIDTASGSRFIYFTDSTRFINFDSTGKKPIGIGDLKIGETIMVVGLNPSTNSGVAKFIIRDQVKQLTSFSLFGKIKTASSTNLTLSTSSELDPVNLLLNSDTVIKTNADKTILPAELQTNDQLALAGIIDSKGSLVTKTILKLDASTKTATFSAR